jgi:hypothetical protein
MKDPTDVLRKKEQELSKLILGIDALRITVRLLNDDPRAAIQRPDAAQLVETR